MKIPTVGEIVKVECNGKPITALVDDVESDPESPLYFPVTLQVLQAAASPRKGEQCYWLLDGQRIPAYLRGDVYTQGEITKFRLRAIADSHQQSDSV